MPRETIRNWAWKLAIGAGAATFALSAPAQAQKTINLTAIDGYPPKAMWVKEFIRYFIPETNKRLAAKGHYKINWNQAWSGQIVKTRHVLEGMQKGLGDIGIITSVFHADKVPLNNLTYVTPFVTFDPPLATRTMDALAARFPAFKDGWKPYNQIALTNGCVLDTYQLFTKAPVRTLADLKGQKLHGAGTNLRYLHGLGAAGVAGSLVGIYNNIKTGVVSGTMLWPEAVIAFKLYEVAPYMLRANIGTACSKSINANADTWRKLPGEVRDVLASVAIGYRDRLANQAVALGKVSYARYEKKGGKITELSAAERANWARSMPNIAKEWAADLEKKGIPGNAILTAYMDTMRKHHQPIMRQWDRE